MTRLSEDLFRLLPLLYQQRDAASPDDNPLRDLLEVLGRQGDAVAADIEQLYDDWFIETCADWVVPYLGDLLGVRLLHPTGPGAGRSRALVANTLDYRRRKGTLAALEQLAYDVTAWPTSAVEYFTRLGVTQHLTHPRPGNVRTPDLRHAAELELLGGPFTVSANTAEVRLMPGGRYNIPNIGLHVWRLAPQRVICATARAVTDPPDGRYTVDPTGLSLPLFNPGTTELGITSLAHEQNVPGPLRRRALYDELEALRAGTVGVPLWFGDDPVVEIWADLGTGLAAIPTALVTAADLSDPPEPLTNGWPRPAAPLTVAVDPVLGRIAFRPDLSPVDVEVTSSYASPGQVGAGPYDRAHPETTDLMARATWFRAVGQRATPVAGVVVNDLAAALDDWNAAPAGTVGAIAVLDSRSYVEDLAGAHPISVPAGSELLIVAVTWPNAEVASPALAPALALAQASPVDRRPHLRGSVRVTGTAGLADAQPGELTVDGLLIEGDVTVGAGDLGRLCLRHVTVVPAAGTIGVEPPTSPDTDNGSLDLDIQRCVVGTISIPDRGPSLEVSTSIVDAAGNPDAIAAPHAPVSLDQVTVLGGTTARNLDASDSILDGPVLVERRQSGCLRFTYLAEGAVAPRRYRCQPDLALTDVSDVSDSARATAIRAKVSPVFSSTRYGDPAYGRLDDRCDPALRTGASNGASMGVFAALLEPQRESNLAAVLQEYLRLGLEAGVIHET